MYGAVASEDGLGWRDGGVGLRSTGALPPGIYIDFTRILREGNVLVERESVSLPMLSVA